MKKHYDFTLEDLFLFKDKDAYFLDILNGFYSIKETRAELTRIKDEIADEIIEEESYWDIHDN